MPETIAQTIDALTGRILTPEAVATGLPLSQSVLEQSSSHDFSLYEYVLDPAAAEWTPVSEMSPASANYIAALKATGASAELVELTVRMLFDLEGAMRAGLKKGFADLPLSAREKAARVSLALRTTIVRLYNTDREVIPDLADLYSIDARRLLSDCVQADFRKHARSILASKMGFGQLLPELPPDAGFAAVDGMPASKPTPPVSITHWSWFDFAESWRERFSDQELASAATLSEYPFQVFPPGSINVGIATVFRQTWALLGTQAGEIIKTVPLAPGQVERVSTKITRRTKSIRRTEMENESETSATTSDTTKDSSDIVLEAARDNETTFEASLSVGFESIGLGGSASGKSLESLSSSTRDTTSSLSETMRKTAQKLKRRSKISVTTESEEGFEMTSSSELSNPNNEIAVTYCYHSVQRQYEVHTYLAEVRNCLFVAEPLPLPWQISTAFLRRNSVTLAKALLDPSFLPILDEVVNEVDRTLSNEARYTEMLDAAQDRFASFTLNAPGNGAGNGLDLPDIYSEPQRMLDQFMRDKEAMDRENRIRALRRERLLDHIRANILHYARALWLAEDPDQRLLRYRKEGRAVPVSWVSTMADEAGVPSALDFSPGDEELPLADLIGGAAPVGTFGNYLVFELRPMGRAARDALAGLDATSAEMRLALHDVLDLWRARYMGPDGNLQDPAREQFAEEADRLIANTADFLSKMADAHVRDVLSYLPRLADGRRDAEGRILRGADNALVKPFTRDDLIDYLMRRDATRRFLVDSNNLYISIHPGDGSALEPFKRAHRALDVLKAQADLAAAKLQNARRQANLDKPGMFDPDIEKVVISSDLPITGSTDG